MLSKTKEVNQKHSMVAAADENDKKRINKANVRRCLQSSTVTSHECVNDMPC